MNLSQLTDTQVSRAQQAVNYLRALPARLDSVLTIKLGTLHADLAAEIEDREAGSTRPPLAPVGAETPGGE